MNSYPPEIKAIKKCAILATSLLLLGTSTAFAIATKATLKAEPFASLLHRPADCPDSAHCSPGAYLVNNATELYNLGTTIGGTQDGTVAGTTEQWSNLHFAILIPQEHYDMPFPFKINYYTQILGVASNRENVVIAPGIDALNECKIGTTECTTTGGLNNFWRGMENLTLNIDRITFRGNDADSLRFAISQAAPIRNIHIASPTRQKNLLLCDFETIDWSCGYTSGGFMADSAIDGNLLAGSQQQFYVENSNFKKWSAGTWNMVSRNNTGTLFPDKTDGSTTDVWGPPLAFPFTDVTTPKYQSHIKPYVIYDNNEWKIAEDYQGNAKNIDANYYILYADKNHTDQNNVTTADVPAINQALANGKNLLIMPGVYNLNQVINVPQNRIVLGLGIPSLRCMSPTGQCMYAEGEQGVHIAGVTFEAGTVKTSKDSSNVLLQVGKEKNNNDNRKNPDVLQDVFCRVAETQSTMRDKDPEAYACVVINANDVYGQDLWLWRADHDKASEKTQTLKLTNWEQDKAQYGLIVNGDNVVMQGLAVEHFQNYQTVWLGQNGKIDFYQSEMPYDVPSINAWSCSLPNSKSANGENGCASLVVGENVASFTGKGLGIYTYFTYNIVNPKKTQPVVVVPSLVLAPHTANIDIEHVVGRWLKGDSGSGYAAIIKDYKNNVYGRPITFAGERGIGSALERF